MDYVQGAQDKVPDTYAIRILGLSVPLGTSVCHLSPRIKSSMSRGGQGDGISSGFEPAKTLVRGYRYPDPRPSKAS